MLNFLSEYIYIYIIVFKKNDNLDWLEFKIAHQQSVY